jgi:acetylornithine deacetylase/succinyl-diaminopimelate desuccinylase-like protein
MQLFNGDDFTSLFDECCTHLSNLIQIKTVNPPGNEKAAAEYLADVLSKENIEAQVLESAPDRANMVARIKGDGSAKPLLICGHIDVVEAEPEHWSHDPFGGEIADGFIWGRGALDMKNMVALELMAMIALKRSGIVPKRDLIFCAVADEEAGCTYGSKWMVENHRELVDAEYAIGEIGGFSITMSGKTFYPVQVAEKGTCWLKITAEGDPGHGSMPHGNNAIGKIGAAAAALANNHLPQHNTATVEAYIREIAANVGPPNSIVLSMLLRKSLSNFILDKVFPDKGLAKTFRANLHNTANPTVLRGGDKINVVPSSAYLEVDGRTLPGQTPEGFIKEVEDLIGPGYKIEVTQNEPPIDGSADDPVFELIRQVVMDNDPDAVVIPNQIPGFTDAKFFTRTGAKFFGFSPVQLEEDMRFADLFHGHDERIPVEGYRWGLKTFLDFIARMVG